MEKSHEQTLDNLRNQLDTTKQRLRDAEAGGDAEVSSLREQLREAKEDARQKLPKKELWYIPPPGK
jgi:hypothetical protein